MRIQLPVKVDNIIKTLEAAGYEALRLAAVSGTVSLEERRRTGILPLRQSRRM